MHEVALLAEGVDRNRLHYICIMEDEVALLAEGVDRNLSIWAATDCLSSRPPRGGRG